MRAQYTEEEVAEIRKNFEKQITEDEAIAATLAKIQEHVPVMSSHARACREAKLASINAARTELEKVGAEESDPLPVPTTEEVTADE